MIMVSLPKYKQLIENANFKTVVGRTMVDEIAPMINTHPKQLAYAMGPRDYPYQCSKLKVLSEKCTI